MFYIYHSDSKIYSHSTQGQVDPQGGGFFIPPNSTTLPPLPSIAGYVTFFNGYAWESMLDIRGTWYNIREEVIVDDILYDTTGLTKEPVPYTLEEEQANIIAHFKGLYLGVVQAKLDELDYDSLATVQLWEGDATFGAEASKILAWYKSIIGYNYTLLNAGPPPPSDEEYLLGLPIYV